MKARLLLFLIFSCILTVLATNGKSNLFSVNKVIIMSKEITLNTELIVSLIIFFTLMGILLIGILEKLFFSEKLNRKKKTEE
jgi:hypothetical protein|tara:strand:- start:219 stop:464 length:246 start_codon:yes stop_codon:yes gene_type:complete